jgi:outer membrane protein assembly factor BamB
VVIGSTLFAFVPPAGAAPGPADWSGYLDGPSHSSYNAAFTSITPKNAGHLVTDWSWKVPSSTAKNGNSAIWASPTVVDGIVYEGSESGWFYAYDEATQTVLWSVDFGGSPSLTCRGTLGVSATATVEEDPVTQVLTVYLNAPDGYLYALNATTGATIWDSFVASPGTTKNTYYAWSSPAVAKGMVYVGISSQCTGPLVRKAGLIAFDQENGTQEARWFSMPTGDKGGSVWSSPAVLANGNVVVATGNADGTNQAQWAESIVELDGQTLQEISAWQLPSAVKEEDYDFGSSPTLFTADLNGVETPMVGACNKNGVYYAFEQDDIGAGPVWQHHMAAAFGKGSGICIAAAIWDGTQLIEGGGSNTTINGVQYMGSVQSLDPATGAVVWATGLAGCVMGSPSEDAGGVIAAPLFKAPNNQYGVFLLEADTGKTITRIATGHTLVFAQPVFADNDLLVAGAGHTIIALEAPTHS